MAILRNYIEGTSTQLNKLKYGDSATIGTEPNIQKRIPTDILQNGPSSNGISKRADDLVRIGKLLTQKPGLKYLANETALNAIKVTPKSDPNKSLAGNIVAGVGANLFNTVKIIGSTLLQVPLNGTGTHFVKGFLSDSKKYINTVGAKVKKESRVRIGDPGLRGNRAIYNDSIKIDTLDKINHIGPIIGNDKIVDAKKSGELNDLIKLRFTVVTPDQEIMLPFRAYLDSFTDDYSSEWETFKYLGRAENFHTYRGFDRNITFSFKIAAQTRYEMRPLYQKMVYLASSLAPTYSQTSEDGKSGGLMRGTFVKLTVGSYVYEVPGFIQNLTYSWEQDFPWEIAQNEETNNSDGPNPDFDQQELPMVMNCNVTFKPIHKFTPQTGLKHFITQDVVAEGKEDKRFFHKGKVVSPNSDQELGINTGFDSIDASVFGLNNTSGLV